MIKEHNKIKPASKDNTNKFMFDSKVIVILSERLINDSHLINIQDFVANGITFIPVFSSKEKFTRSTKGADLGKQIIEIDGIFLLSLLKGNETLRVNPGLEDEEDYEASDLISTYKAEIKNLQIKLSGLKK